MFKDPKGPIESFSFGKFVIIGKEHSKSPEGKIGVGKDIRLIGEEVTWWKEREGHELIPDMITGIYNRNIDILIIGIGMNGLLEVPMDVRGDIYKHGIKSIKIKRTPDACKLYNELYHKGEKVALLAHGTC
jgi:hypothetical protein